MISQETIQKLAIQYQAADHPNIVREYFQHLFLSLLYKEEKAQNILFKGGTALRIIFGSHRFSEDLDFSIFNIREYEIEGIVGKLFITVLAKIERLGIKVELESKSGKTSGGYRGVANFVIYNYPATSVTIEASSRNGRDVRGEIEIIVNDFIPNYNLYHLPQDMLVTEKIKALLTRKKARDFYDIYFMMRKNLLKQEHKVQLAKAKDLIMTVNMNFKKELGVLLPSGQQAILTDFKRALTDELNRQLAG